MVPQADQLSERFRVHCSQRHWQPRQLPNHGPANEHQLLEELIACRDAGRADLSLELINIADQHGWQSPWLNDNRARAELDLGRPEIAESIWQNLTKSNDSAAAAAAARWTCSGDEALLLAKTLFATCRDIGLGRARGVTTSAEPSTARRGDGLAHGEDNRALLIHKHRNRPSPSGNTCSPTRSTMSLLQPVKPWTICRSMCQKPNYRRQQRLPVNKVWPHPGESCSAVACSNPMG